VTVTEQQGKATANYLNVDLEIRSRSDLQPLADAVADRLFVLHIGKVAGSFFLSLEVLCLPGGPDAAIKQLGRVMSRLPAPARRLWTGARDRVFDIGIEATVGSTTLALALEPETVKLVGRLKARIALTVYPRNTRRRRLTKRRGK